MLLLHPLVVLVVLILGVADLLLIVCGATCCHLADLVPNRLRAAKHDAAVSSTSKTAAWGSTACCCNTNSSQCITSVPAAARRPFAPSRSFPSACAASCAVCAAPLFLVRPGGSAALCGQHVETGQALRASHRGERCTALRVKAEEQHMHP